MYLPDHQLIPDVEIEFDIFFHSQSGPPQVLNLGQPHDHSHEFLKHVSESKVKTV